VIRMLVSQQRSITFRMHLFVLLLQLLLPLLNRRTCSSAFAFSLCNLLFFCCNPSCSFCKSLCFVCKSAISLFTLFFNFNLSIRSLIARRSAKVSPSLSGSELLDGDRLRRCSRGILGGVDGYVLADMWKS